ncbi:MAG: alpha/beta fold hydrolase [Nevskiales bacterium]
MDATWIDTLILPWQRRKILSGPAASSRKDVHFVQLTAATLRYRISGQGPKTIVLVTDPPVVLEQYDDLIWYLAGDYRVVVFEMAAFGFSLPHLGTPFHFESAVGIVREFLTRLDLGPSVLAFPCAAAYMAIALAGWHPELVSDLVIIQAPDWHEEQKWKRTRDPKNILGRPYIGQILISLLKRRRVGDWYRLALGNPALLDEFLQPTLEAFGRGARFSLASSFQKYLTEAEPAFAPVRQPTLIVWGKNDRSHCKTDMASTLRYAPHAQLVYLPETGHFPELERPKEFANLLHGFFRNSSTE